MSLSFGTDIEEVTRFKHLLEKKPLLLKKLFSDYEWHYASQKNTAQTLTGIWCAKESIVKALSAINIEVLIRDVNIGHLKSGVPILLCIHGLHDFDLSLVKVSISHTANYAVASCIILESSNS
jgi:holo-[acyl-carrier protein] synthase